MNFGLNLYSLRKQISTVEDFESSVLKLKKMGYSYLQFSGAPFNSASIKQISEKTNMPFMLTHVPFDRILNDTKNLVEEHKSFGCTSIGLGSMQFKSMSDEEIKENIAKLEKAGKTISSLGAKFFYHNHAHEFCKLSNGQTIYDYIIENTEHVNFILDTYWLQVGGVSITDYINKTSGRIECVHLKDYLPCYGEHGIKGRFAPVGEGNINWKAVIDCMKNAGAKHFFVEQDDACDYENPFAQVKSSIDYLINNFGKV